MSKGNKIILYLAIAVFVALSVFVSLVAVFAEENQIVRNLNVSFKVYNADCHVAASYTIGDETNDFTISGLEDDEKYLTFDKTDATKNIFQEKMLKPTNDIALTKESNSVIFKFDIVNFDFNAVEITIVLDGKINENLEIKYSKDGNVWSDNNVRINLAGTEGVAPQETSYFVRLSLKNENQEFSFNQNFEVAIHNKI